MIEPLGFCERHQLPLDGRGECELCRLSDIPSKAPRAGSPWWALIIPLVLVVAAVAWAMSSFVSEPGEPPPRGVRPSPAQHDAPQPSGEEPRRPEPVHVPEPPPLPSQEPPVPEPGSEGTEIDPPSPRPSTASETPVPEWKWNLARRRVTVTMYATQWCSVCKRAREYMHANQIEFIELDTEKSAAAMDRLGEINPGKTVPTFEIDGFVQVGFHESRFDAQFDRAARKYL